MKRRRTIGISVMMSPTQVEQFLKVRGRAAAQCGTDEVERSYLLPRANAYSRGLIPEWRAKVVQRVHCPSMRRPVGVNPSFCD